MRPLFWALYNAKYNPVQFFFLSEHRTIQNCKLKRMSETNVKWKWTEMVKLSNKKDKLVSQNFIKPRPYDNVNLGQIV